MSYLKRYLIRPIYFPLFSKDLLLNYRMTDFVRIFILALIFQYYQPDPQPFNNSGQRLPLSEITITWKLYWAESSWFILLNCIKWSYSCMSTSTISCKALLLCDTIHLTSRTMLVLNASSEFKFLINYQRLEWY